MDALAVDPQRIRGAWLGRISGCQLGKAVELLSMRLGLGELTSYLERAGALPLRDYVPLLENTLVAAIGRRSCRGTITRSEPDDDINYTVLGLVREDARTEGGHRLYSDEAIETLKRVVTLKRNMSLAEIRKLLRREGSGG